MPGDAWNSSDELVNFVLTCTAAKIHASKFRAPKSVCIEKNGSGTIVLYFKGKRCRVAKIYITSNCYSEKLCPLKPDFTGHCPIYTCIYKVKW